MTSSGHPRRSLHQRSARLPRCGPVWGLLPLLLAVAGPVLAADHAEALYFLGVERLNEGDTEGAYALFRRVPTAPEVDLERSSFGDIGYRRELIQLLVTEGTEALDPTFNVGKLKQAVRARARTRMAEIHMERNEYPQAVELLLIANRDDMGYPLAHCRLAESCLRLGDPGKAINAGKEAYLLSPTYRLYRRTYATALATDAERIESEAQTGKAMLAYDFAFQIDPLNPTCLANYGYYLYRTGLTGQEQDAKVSAAIARYNRLKGVYLLEQAAQLAVHDPRLQLRAASVFQSEGRPARALEFYERAVGGGRTAPEAIQGCAWALIALGEYDRALERLLPLAKDQPQDVETHVALGEVYLAQRKLRDAEKQAGLALKLDKNSVGALYVAGACRLADRDSKGAERFLRRAVELGPETRAGVRAQTLLAQHALKFPKE